MTTRQKSNHQITMTAIHHPMACPLPNPEKIKKNKKVVKKVQKCRNRHNIMININK